MELAAALSADAAERPSKPLPAGWDEQRVERELHALVQQRGRWVSSAALRRAGLNELEAAVAATGGSEHWRLRLGYEKPSPGRPRVHSVAAATQRVRPLVQQLGRWPWPSEFAAAGLAGVEEYLSRRSEERQAVAEALGVSVERGTFSTWNSERIEREVREFAEGAQYFPSKGDLLRAGRADLLNAMNRHGGRTYWAQRLGMPVRPSGVPVGTKRNRHASLRTAAHPDHRPVARRG